MVKKILIGYLLAGLSFAVRDLIVFRTSETWSIVRSPFLVAYTIGGNLLFWWIYLIYGLIKVALRFMLFFADQKEKTK